MVIARQLTPILEACSKLYGTYFGPHNLGRTGMRLLRAPLKGPILNKWYLEDMRSAHNMLWNDAPTYHAIDRDERREMRGKTGVRKGSGKKAQKRAKEMAKAAAKAAKEKK
eukprot:TRINITY_DN5051_c0_g1_i1.p1 TRINITY_DN5051_c0_g1~~TRINITY_DN5051_c0_g1_i1.p1  ORF type:complete len:111 (+),score=20.77 TRINITY_DN5051_c0_g1_i1:234-566(+)